MRRTFILVAILITAFFLCLAGIAESQGSNQKIYPIWPGAAPGSETWNWPEAVDTSEWHNDPLAYNVVQPMLTYYPADPSTANGTAVLIFPGGAFCYLHVKTEGSDLAAWLNKRGVAVFVLKYRVAHSLTTHPVKEKNARARDSATARQFATLVPMAIADATQAFGYIHEHASEWPIDINKLGIMGFSAGGTLACAIAFGYAPGSRPAFAAPIYAYVPTSMPVVVKPDAPPLFVAAATDDEAHLVPTSLDLYNKWLSAGRSAEIHIYSRGGHGFGMNRQDLPSDTWIDRFGDWLQIQGFLKK